MFVLALAFALFIGVALGLLGGGGSILTLPILKYVVGQEAHVAIASSLFVVGVTSLVSLYPHAKGGRVRWQTGFVFGAASMLGAFLAGLVAKKIPAEILLVLFSLMMLVTAVAMLRGKKERASTCSPDLDPSAAPPSLPIAKVLLEGLAVGAVTGLVGAGGGFLVVPALVLLGGLPMNIAVGTSLLVLSMKSFAGFAGHAANVTIDWSVLLPITGMALVGSFVGARLVAKIPAATLRRAFGWFVIVMGVFMLAQEVPPLFGDIWPIGIPLALAAAAAGIAVVVERVRGHGAHHAT
jgi:uncharacterized membrane protein YfcA